MPINAYGNFIEPLPRNLPELELGEANMLMYEKVQEIIGIYNNLVVVLEGHTHDQD